MDTLFIGYDLRKPETSADYTELIDAIKGISGTWWHCLDSTWLVRTNMTCAVVRDLLLPYIDANDELLVAKMAHEGAWFGFGKNCSDWLLSDL